MWVRSQYAAELAVVSAWISVLLPWNVAYQGDAPEGGTVYFFRFALFELQIRQPGAVEINGELIEASEPLAATYPGTELVGSIFVATPPGAVTFYDGALSQASLLWTVAAAAFAGAFVLSLALYVREEAVADRLPASEVRLMGGLLGIAALGTAGASVLFYQERSAAGLPIPVGVLVIGALAAVLYQTEAIEPGDA
jgi:uncharacterized protein (TIGR04206 family)